MATERKLILRHVGGSKAGHVEEFDLDGAKTFGLGRDESSDVRFGDSDDLVSRKHAELSVRDGDSPELEVIDLGSSNGTFVNKQRLSGSMTVKAGDTIQLGAGGPEIEIDLDPRPEGAAKATRLATPAAAATRMAEAPGAKRGVGKETVERIITDTKEKSKRQALTLAAIVLAVLAAVVVVVIYQGRSIGELGETSADARSALDDLRAGTPLEPSAIAAANESAVVKIESIWRLVDMRTGDQVYQFYRDGRPTYVMTGNGIEPQLIRDGQGNTNRPIWGGGSGSGFVVTEEGFVLTNRHVAAGWDYPFGRFELPGLLFNEIGQLLGVVSAQGSSLYLENADGVQALGGQLQKLMSWAPANARGAVGRSDTLNVVFPKTKERIPARMIRISDRADAALIKIDVPTRVTTVELYDNYNTVSPGEQVIVMGYPGVSEEATALSRSFDPIRRGVEEVAQASVPEPTVTVGGIGRVYRADAQALEDADLLVTSGDSYQLTINATGQGNSGGPVFDDYGRVIAIFAWALERGGARVTGAVPIKYGIDLLQIKPVVQ